MLKNIVEYSAPKDLKEAQRLLEQLAPRAQVVGGGLDLTWRERRDVKYLIGLDNLSLNFLELENGALKIGAQVTVRQLLESEIAGNFDSGFLRLALKRVATPLLRGVITVGGALAQAYPWGDLPALFLGLESRIVLFDGQERTVELGDFYSSSFREVLRRTIITQVILPLKEDRFSSYQRFSRVSVDIPLLNQMVSLKFQKRKIKKAKVLLGSRPGFPQELREVQDFLERKDLEGKAIEEASALAQKTASVEGDFRLSQEFRKHLIGIFLERNLKEIKRKYEDKFQAQ